MKSFKHFLLLSVGILMFQVGAIAQKNFFRDAEKAFKTRQYYVAIELYKKAYASTSKKDEKAKVIFQIAECYRLFGDIKNAEVWYEKAIKINYPDPKAQLYLADAKKADGKYDEALAEYNNYKKLAPDDPRGETGAKSCELAAKWKENPSRYKVDNVAQINTKQSEYSPSWADKKYSSLYITSNREGVTGKEGAVDGSIGQNFYDIFETKLDKNGKWSTPMTLPEPINTGANESSTVLSKKGNLLIFNRCNVAKGKIVPCEIYMSVKKGMVWDDPKLIPLLGDTAGYMGHMPDFAHPALSADEQTLIFGSNMKGGYGSSDLWMCKYNKDKGEWGKPENLGPTINTTEYEDFPYLHDDGSLYFSSTGHIGMGGMDIFKAKQLGDGKWGEVTNLQSPINSAADDFGIIFEGKKERGYFASNREGGKGLDDIWQFTLPPLLFTIEGVVTDCKYKETIEGVTMKLIGSDGSSVETKTDKTGYYKFAENGENRYVNEATSYVLSTAVANSVKTNEARKGFLASSVKAKETTVGINESKIFKHDFCLTPIETFIRFPEVQYDLGKSNLRPESKDSLDFLYETLMDNPTFVIELSAHTDSRGNNKLNDTLSQNRAQSCVDYLISRGINPARMKAKGYGAHQLLIKDDVIYKMKTKEEQEAAHQKNRRTVFSVLSRDFVDPNAKPEPAKVVEEPKKEEAPVEKKEEKKEVKPDNKKK